MHEIADRKTVLIASATLAAVCVLTGFRDLAALPPGDAVGYALGRGICTAAAVTLAARALADRVPRGAPVMTYLLVLVYALHAQAYRPNYWMVMIELNALFPIFFVVRRATLAALYGLGTGAFVVALLLVKGRFTGNGAVDAQLAGDAIAGLVVTTTFAFVGYNGVALVRVERELLLRRFATAGKGLGFLLHDLKGMLSSPLIHVAALEQRADAATLANLREDLTAVRAHVLETSRVMWGELDDAQPRRALASEAVQAARVILASRLGGLVIEHEGELALALRPELLRGIVVNAVLNAFEALERSGRSSGTIRVRCDGETLAVSDDSGSALSPRELRVLNSGHRSFSRKEAGGGVGTLIIRDCAGAAGARVTYANGPTGVALTIRFPRQAVLTCPES
jgi:hypothetical protein